MSAYIKGVDCRCNVAALVPPGSKIYISLGKGGRVKVEGGGMRHIPLSRKWGRGDVNVGFAWKWYIQSGKDKRLRKHFPCT